MIPHNAGHVPEVVNILADSVANPLLLEEEIQQQKVIVGELLSTLRMGLILTKENIAERELSEAVDDPGLWIPELLHQAAFGSEGLGQTVLDSSMCVLCPQLISWLLPLPSHLHLFSPKNPPGPRLFGQDRTPSASRFCQGPLCRPAHRGVRCGS